MSAPTTRALIDSLAGALANDVVYDLNGNIQRYVRPVNSTIPGADGATLTLSGYTAFNLPTQISKTLSGTITASGEFFYDAGYQRIRQIKRSGAVQTGTFADDILYVVPGSFEVHRDASGRVVSSIATISGPDGVAASVTTSFDAGTGQPLAQNLGANVTSNNSGGNTVTKLILKDHLGSMVAEITLGGTAASPTVLVSSLTIHGFGPWGNARNGSTIASQLADGQRGFTGHEHLAELGIIHMNGRLYDPVLGRFLQADPIIQAPHNAQSHNRYSYVLNNPLSFTDPSGFSAWTQWRGPIIGIVVSIITYGAASWAMGAYATLYGSTAFATAGIASTSLTGVGSATAAAAAGFAAGGLSGGNIQSALQGAFTAVLMQGLLAGFDLPHGAPGTLGELAGKVAVHAAVGCVGGAMAGGSCGRGAAAGGFSEFAGTLAGAGPMGQLGLQEGSPAHFAVQVAAGCAAGRLGGGSCSNGAFTAAFNYTTNILVGLIPAAFRLAIWMTPRMGIIEAGAMIATGTAGPGIAGAEAGATRLISITEERAAKIFGDRVGHIADSPANRELIEGLVNDSKALLGPDKWGNQWYGRVVDSGEQLWAQVRNGIVWNAGVNSSPKEYSKVTGLARETRGW